MVTAKNISEAISDLLLGEADEYLALTRNLFQVQGVLDPATENDDLQVERVSDGTFVLWVGDKKFRVTVEES